MGEWNSASVMHFNDRLLPGPGRLAGYAALIAHYDLALPLPPRLSAVAARARPAATPDWNLVPAARAPADTLAGHLEFALKWEGVDLGVLHALFARVEDREVSDIVRARPSGIYARRLWFLFEWLTGRTLDVPDAGKVRAVPAIDPAQQFALPAGLRSSRHRVVDNLPGTRAFCPLVRRTPVLDAFAARHLDVASRDVVGRTHPDLLARAAAFLLLSDSRASFAIEGEQATGERAARWAKAIADAGRRSLSIAELERLQRIVIGDSRFVRLGVRAEGGFVGAHDRQTREPLPDHVSARAEDLGSLLDGVIAYAERARVPGVDAVASAAAIAFGFVYIHPFEDGNGRLHRWLIHHVLATAGYNPPGVVFPVSAAILRRLDAYRRVLESYSRPLLPFIDWRPTAHGNVEVTSPTGAFYRYFDATAHAEFLYACVADTVERDLPCEVAFLHAFDRFVAGVKALIDMPDRTIDLLHRFLRQGGGHLSRRAREREFAAFTEQEIAAIEALHAECFDGIADPASAGN